VLRTIEDLEGPREAKSAGREGNPREKAAREDRE
jgi:hypothetical protein